MSGEKTFEILAKMFIAKNPKDISEIPGYTMQYGNIVDDGKIIDEVLVSYFKAPKSYTTEDMCEINSHGGNVIMRKILQICLKNGANLAEPGEFTKRAFLNGRIDLAQAESVIDVINAKSEREAKSGIKQLEGFLSAEINQIKQDILDVLVNIEVTIDYPEYDTPEVQENELKNMLNKVENKLEKLEKSFDNGKIIKDGIKTAIIGKPNAGKSSLLNAILKEDRAIVTDIAGTTRDTIEEYVTINGIALKLIDTAGIREAKDSVEKIGIQKSIEEANDADLIIAIFDSSKELDEEDYEILKLIKNKKWDMLIPYLIILGITAILILALDGSYWARYIPYFYAVPILMLSYLLWEKDKKIHFVLGVMISIIMLVNTLIVLYTTLTNTRNNDAYIGKKINDFVQCCHENEVVEIKLNHIGVQGALYNMDDLGIKNYEVKEEIENEREGYFFQY